jgi:putative transposase
MNPFTKDKTIWIKGVEMRVVRQLEGSDVQLENTKSGELVTQKLFNLLQQYASGELLTAGQRRHELRTGEKRPKRPARMDHLSPAAKAETRRRMDYLIRLKHMDSFEKSRKKLSEDIVVVAAAKGDLRAPDITTVYRWRRKYLIAQRDIRALFCEFDKQGGKGQSRLDPEVEAIIFDKIETIFLARKRGSAEEIHNAVFLEIQRRNTERIEREWLTVPGLRTIQRRLHELPAFDLAVARFGQKEAERRFAHHMGARSVSRILELVEIDHSPVDIMVTNDDGIVLGRPTITLVLDRKSRCVLGFHLSMAGHGTSAVFAALRHALLPKTYLKSRYADLQLEWDCFGWFEVLLMDNGREFHAESVSDALINLAIATEYAKSREPNDKPHVERFLKTFNYSFIHRQPGTTLSKVHERIGFKAEDEACLTLAELDRMIHVWICQVYHQRRHAGLDGRTPIAVWRESAAVFPPQLKANSEDLDIEFSQIDSRVVQHYGLDLNTFVYVSPRLLTLRRMLPVGSHQLETLLKKCGVRLVILNEANHLVDRGRERSHYLLGDWIKLTSEKTGVPFVLVGIPRVNVLMGVNEQLADRVREVLTVEPFGVDARCKNQMSTALAAFDKLLEGVSRVPIADDSNARRFAFATAGRLRRIRRMLEESARAAAELAEPKIDLPLLARVFREHVFKGAPDERNPFVPAKFDGRPLTGPGEPYEPRRLTREEADA